MSAPKHTSFSSLDSYDTCALRWFHERVLKTPSMPSRLLLEGVLSHKVIELYTEELYQSGLDKHPAAIPELVQRVFTEHERIASTEYYAGVLMVASTFAKHFILDVDNIIEVEMECELELGEGYPKLLTFIDRVARAYDDKGSYLLVTDVKTGWSRTQTPGNIYQLEVEGLQLHTRYPDERIAVQNQFARFNIYTEPHFLSEWDWDRTISRTKAIYDRQQASFANKQWPANPGNHCTYCGVVQHCDVIKGLTGSKQVAIDKDSALLRLREAVVLEAALKATKGVIKPYVDTSGAIRLDDGMGAAYVTSPDTLTISDLAKAYDALGDELWGILRPDAKTLKKYEDDPRLEGLWEEKPGKSAFKIGKGLGDEEGEE